MLLPLIALSLPSLAATLTVDAAGGADHATIQAAIDAASTGDSIEIAAGAYAECIDTGGKDLSLVGAGTDDVTLDGDGLCTDTVTIDQGETVRISGLVLRNTEGRAVEVLDSSLELSDAAVRDSGSDDLDGGGIAIVGGSLTLTEVELDGNATTNGGHIYIGGGAAVTITDSTLRDGSARYGGAILMEDEGSSLSISGSQVEANTALLGGSGIYLHADTTLASNGNTFDSNGSDDCPGGGWYLGAGGSASSTGDEFRDNGAEVLYDVYGGGIYLTGATLTVDGSSFEGNHGAAGGAIFATTGSSVHTSAASFETNEARYGGGVYIFDGSSYVDESSVFTWNDGSSSAGGVIGADGATLQLVGTEFVENTGHFGGALHVSTNSSLSLDGALFQDNTSDYQGGAVYLVGTYDDADIRNSTFTGNRATGGNGGAIFVSTDSGLELSDSTLQGNSAEGWGGGLYAYDGSGDRRAWLSNSTFAENEATHGGAAVIYYYGSAILTGLSVRDNVASSDGGGLYLWWNSAAEIEHSWFCGNAAGRGGGAYAYYPVDGTTWTNNAFVENSASLYGGGLYAHTDDDLVLLNNVLIGNSAPDGGGLYASNAFGTYTNNLVAWTGAGGAFSAADANSGSTYASVTYNNWYENTGGSAAGYFDFLTSADGNIAVDPELVDYSLDGDCGNDVLVPRPGSPLVDAGDPAILDPDGSTSDIGMYGGPASLAVDADGDGWLDLSDCDDDDPDINPDATETWYDGVDSDCDGASDDDADGDGYDSDTVGGPDCDDADAGVNPSVEEIPDDGIDQDCDGEDATGGSDGGAGDGGADGGSGDGGSGDGGSGDGGSGDGGSGDGGSGDGGSGDGGAGDGGAGDGGAGDGGADDDDDDDDDGKSGCAHAPVPTGPMGAVVLLVTGLIGLRRRPRVDSDAECAPGTGPADGPAPR